MNKEARKKLHKELFEDRENKATEEYPFEGIHCRGCKDPECEGLPEE